MVEKTESTVCKRFDGKDLATPVPYSFTWSVYKDEEEFSLRGTPLTVKEQMKVRDDAAYSKARAAKQSAALTAAGIVKDTAATSVQVAMRETLKPMLVNLLPDGSRKFTDEQARTFVENLFGEKFVD